MTNDEIRHYLHLQARVRAELWPEYSRAAHEVIQVSDGFALDGRAELGIASILGTPPGAPRACAFADRLEAHMLAYFGNCCAYCGAPLGMRRMRSGAGGQRIQTSPWAPAYARDHVCPRTHGGLDAHTNYVPACGACNQSKKAKDLDVWRPKK
jgi:hypothetical protein